MDFAEDPGTRAFREEVRAVLSAHLSPPVFDRVHLTGTHHDWPLHRALAAKGWLAAALPVELGGQGRRADELAALFREMELAGAPYDGMANAMMVAFILGHVGTPFQRAEVLVPLLAGDAIPCLGYSEPESGSDVAAAATTAVRDGDRWTITGQKMFTSLAEEATWVLLLTRTNHDVPKHKGLTFFLVQLDDPAIEIQAVRTLSGKRTNITFYDGVQVADGWRVGEVDGGWQVMLVALAFERGVAGGVSDVSALYQAATAHFATARDADGRRLLDDPHTRARLVRTAIDKEVADLLGARAAWSAMKGLPNRRVRKQSCSAPKPTAGLRPHCSTRSVPRGYGAATPTAHRPADSSSTPTATRRSSPPQAAPARSRRTSLRSAPSACLRSGSSGRSSGDGRDDHSLDWLRLLYRA